MFDFTKTYANKKGLVAALRKVGIDPETVIIAVGDDTRWVASEKVEEIIVEAAAPVAKRGAPKSQMPTQNGIKHPKAGGLCAQAWALFDELGRDVIVQAALAEGYKRNLNDNNIRTELCRWRKFHGITKAK